MKSFLSSSNKSPRPKTSSPGESLPNSNPLKLNEPILSDKEKELASMLVNLEQHHIFSSWAPPGTHDDLKHKFFAQVETLHKSYPSPGGLVDYIRNARKLLRDAKMGVNALDGWVPEVPTGVVLEPMSSAFTNYENIGLSELAYCGFVLVAGGLGERLGYSGSKLELPCETTTGTCYLELYIQSILAIQAKFATNGRKIPLAIMVSDDTFSKTINLLEGNNFFGMDSDQLTIMKQEKVAALTDSDAHISMKSPYEIDSKPHGHGDVHSLMHKTGTAWKWQSAGVKWCFFFQDTNGLAFHTLPSMLGVSASLELEVNSMAIPRYAKQAVGAIVKLVHDDGREMTVNVEYNQLDPLLRATVSSQGDVNIPSTGRSPFPGNINQLIFQMEPYLRNLNETHGLMGEFVNPKYTDSTNQAFKKPSRLECMMQDYPKILDASAKVGFTSAPTWICYSPCKNNVSDAAISIANGVPAGSAYIAESDKYYLGAELLRRCGARVLSAAPMTINGITAVPGPQIVFHPSFVLFPSDMEARFPSPKQVQISPKSALIIEGDVVVESLWLDGFLKVKAAPGTKIIVRAGQKSGGIFNPAQEVVPLSTVASYEASEVEIMRGFFFRIDGQETVDTSSFVDSAELLPGMETKTYIYNGRNLYPATSSELKPSLPSEYSCFFGFC